MAIYRSSAVCFGSGWDDTCLLKLGDYYFWVDAFDILRIKDSAPTYDTDGSPVGSGGGGGEANTASNVGVSGTGVFKQKVGVDLQFKTISSGSPNVYVEDDIVNNQINIDVRNDLPSWNAVSIYNNPVSSGTPADDQILRWSATNGEWVYDDESSGIGSEVKSGIALKTSFSGTRKKYTVIFSIPYPDTSYSVVATPVTMSDANYMISIEDKTSSSFVIAAGSENINKLIEVDWQTTSV